MSLRKTIIEELGLRRSIVGMLVMVVLVGMGERMGERFLPVYLIFLGSGMLWPGFLNALNNLLSALYSFPGGWLADRVGVKRSMLMFNLLAMAGFLMVVIIPRWEAVIAGSCLFLSWTAISLPGTMSLVSKTLPQEKHVTGISMHSLMRRLPMALGPIVGGIFIDTWGPITGVRLAFAAATVMALVALVMQQILIEETGGNAPSHELAINPLRVLRGFTPALKQLLVADILVRFCEQIPYAYVVLWCVQGNGHGGVTATQFGLLTAIEMATAVICYLPVARFADKGVKKPFVVITFLNFTLFPLLLFFCRSFEWLVLAFILRGLKEFGEPTRKSLIMDLAPEGRKAAGFGTYYLCRDVIVSLSAFMGAFLWAKAPAANLFAATAFGAAGTLWFALRGSDLTPPSKPGPCS
jgi:MFS family permease